MIESRVHARLSLCGRPRLCRVAACWSPECERIGGDPGIEPELELVALDPGKIDEPVEALAPDDHVAPVNVTAAEPLRHAVTVERHAEPRRRSAARAEHEE